MWLRVVVEIRVIAQRIVFIYAVVLVGEKHSGSPSVVYRNAILVDRGF
jgi:hypothetical protein